MSLVRLIYISDVRIDLKNGPMLAQLRDILDASDRNNSAYGITGGLVFDSESFVQVLEGTLESVWSTYKRIERDSRHDHVKFVEMSAVPSRRFGDWFMGCAERVSQHDEIFAPYLYRGRFEPAYMPAGMIMSLMSDLSARCFAPPTTSANVSGLLA